MTRLKYDYEMLKNIFDDGNVTLLVDYKDKYLTRDTRIIGKCILCENSFNKSLNKLHKQRNFGCEKCAKILKFERIKNTMLEKYGVEYAAKSEHFRDKMKSTTLERYGVEHGAQSEEVKEKTRQTNLKKYGVEYGLQNKAVKEKSRITNLEKYSVENPLQRKEIREQIKETNLKKYGVEYASQSKNFQDKCKKTILEKYGVEHFTQTDIMKEKTIKTNLEKYGVENCMQNPEIMEKNIKMSYYLKEYTLPSGNIIKIQGYEHFALNELLKNINENDIITGCKNVPTIWYNDESGKKHRHFVDIFVSSQNKCIEVKSTWTFKKQKEIVLLKKIAAKELGYLYEIWVYNNKAEIVECHK